MRAKKTPDQRLAGTAMKNRERALRILTALAAHPVFLDAWIACGENIAARRRRKKS